MSDKTSKFLDAAVVCLLLLMMDCISINEETTKPKPVVSLSNPAESKEKISACDKTTKLEGKPKESSPALGGADIIELALKFTPQDLTAYRLITEAEKSVEWEGPLSSKPSGFEGGHTASRIEMTFTQRIQNTDDKGDAVAEITIKQLKYLAKVRDNVVLDFDSSREKDRDNLLSKLIGQSYTIEISPAGRVLKILDVNEARAAARGDTSAQQTASALLSDDAIKQRHTILALPVIEKNKLHKAESWTDLESLSFGMMGSKSYEKIYTLKEIKDTDNQQIAIVEMNAIPSSEKAEQLHKEQAAGVFSKLFDNTETYTGELKLNLTAGKIEKYIEKLRTEWIAVDPFAEQQDDKEPAALKMAATRLYHIEKIDQIN